MNVFMLTEILHTQKKNNNINIRGDDQRYQYKITSLPEVLAADLVAFPRTGC